MSAITAVPSGHALCLFPPHAEVNLSCYILLWQAKILPGQQFLPPHHLGSHLLPESFQEEACNLSSLTDFFAKFAMHAGAQV